MISFPKNGPVRLGGAEMSALRIARFLFDRGRCVKCKRRVYLDAPQGHPLKMDLAHVIGRGAGGPDTLENTRTNCSECHSRKHNGEKPCPKKELSA